MPKQQEVNLSELKEWTPGNHGLKANVYDIDTGVRESLFSHIVYRVSGTSYPLHVSGEHYTASGLDGAPLPESVETGFETSLKIIPDDLYAFNSQSFNITGVQRKSVIK